MPKFIYNSIDKQEKKYANELTIKEWNDIINILTTQSNANTEYTELVHRWLVGDGNELPNLKGKSLFEYISTMTPPSSGGGGSGAIKPIEDILDSDSVNALYETMANGIYAIISEQYGHEFVIINKELDFFKRITGYHDYVYDFELEEWIAVAGAGGSAGNVYLTLLSEPMRTLAVTAECKINYTFKSTQSKTGLARCFINDIQVAYDNNVKLGENTFDLTGKLVNGTNSIRIVVTDQASNTGVIDGIIYTGVALNISAYLDTSKAYLNNEPFILQYKVLGEGTKDIYMHIDGNNVYELKDSTASGIATNVTLDMSGITHGVHTLTMYTDATVEGVYIKSNVLTFKFIYAHVGNSTPIILSTFETKETYTQGDIVIIDYLAYTYGRDTTPITLTLNGDVILTKDVPFVKQTWELTKDIINLSTDSPVTAKINSLTFTFNLLKATYDLNPIPGYELNLTAMGKSGNDIWDVNGVPVTMEGFNPAINSWQLNDEGNSTVMRVTGNAKMTIPFYIFNKNILTLGKTIEFEFSTRDVYDISKELITCYTTSGGRKIGLSITANDCIMQSLSTTVKAKYKDNERVKVSFVVLPSSSPTKLMYVYINGIFSGFNKYLDSDFSQGTPVAITVNPNKGAIDIYSIRIYDFALSAPDIVHNYIIDLPPEERALAITRNDILDANKQTIVSAKAQELIPILTFKGKLPTTKDTGQSTDESLGQLTFVNKKDPRYNFTFWVILKIQGTSSVGYPIKNYKATILDTDANGQPYKNDKGKWVKHKEGIIFYEGGIPEHTFTFKADYMESSHSHNTGNAVLIDSLIKSLPEDLAPTFPTQADDERVRNTIYGYPTLFFVQEDETLSPVCYGVYNFNNDKGNYDTLGLKEGGESWEFKNNTSDRCKFLTGDFSSKVDNDFEARYPDGSTNYDNLQRVVSWVASTNGDLEKFKNEFEQYFNKKACLFYTVMMDVMMATDSRAKNMFLDTADGTIWYPRWYDIDTTYGLNNEGELKFTYSYNQDDPTGNGYVYNGHDSLLWNNFNAAFADEIKSYYNELRINGLSYERVLSVLKEHQIDKISETMYNVDGQFKYESLLSYGQINDKPSDSYMYAAQGDRLEHLKWWLYNHFNYLDSRHMFGDYLANPITMRLYSTDSAYTKFSITPYADAYIHAKYGANASEYSYVRAYAGVTSTLTPTTEVDANDLDTYIYGTKNITSIGNLTRMYIGTLNMQNAPRIRELIVNDGSVTNNNFNKLELGNISSLEILKVMKCPNLEDAVNLSNCPNLREVHLTGTKVSSVLLPETGGVLTTLKLPNTITELKLRNQLELTTLTLEGYTNLQTVIIDNCPNISNLITLASNIASKAINISTFEIKNINWNLSSSDSSIITTLYNAKCTLTGKITIRGTFSSSTLDAWANFWPELEIDLDGNITDTRVIVFYDSDNTTVKHKVELSVGGTYTFNSTLPSIPNKVLIGWSTVQNSTQVEYGAKDPITVNDDLYLYPVFIDYDWTEIVIKPYESLSLYIHWSVLGAFGTYTRIVDWGDGGVTNTGSNSYYLGHTYANEYLGKEITVKIFISPQVDGTLYDYIYFNNDSSSGVSTSGAYKDIYKINKIQKNVYKTIPLLRKALITDITIPDHITSIGDSTFYYCTSLTNVTIPNSVTSIGPLAFAHCDSLPSIIIPNSVTSIGNSAFSDCTSLTNVTIPDSVTSIGNDAFESCTSLTSVTIPNSVTSIGTRMFYGCTSLINMSIPFIGTSIDTGKLSDFFGNTTVPVKYVVITGDITTIPDSAFYYCRSLTSITILNSVTSIGDRAFGSCHSLTDITIPDSVTSIGDYAFSDCNSLTNIIIPDSVTSIGEYTFESCDSLTNITIPDSVTSIGGHAFYRCTGLTNIIIPDSVTSIGDHAFYYCTNLTSITIPNSITSIDKGAFSDCPITTLHYLGTIDSWCNITFGAYSSNPLRTATSFYVYDGIENYILPDEVTISEAKPNTLGGNSQITSIIFAEGVTTINNVILENSNNITSITLPSTLVSLTYVSSHTKNLNKVYYNGDISTWLKIDSIKGLFAEITSNGGVTVNNNAELYFKNNNTYELCTSIDIPEGIISIPSYAFLGYTHLNSVHFSSTVKYIGAYSFAYTNLSKYKFPSNLLQIEDYAFYYSYNKPSTKPNYTEIFLPHSLIYIGMYAFYGVYPRVYIPTSVTHVGYYAFGSGTISSSDGCILYIPHATIPSTWNTNWCSASSWSKQFNSIYELINGVTYTSTYAYVLNDTTNINILESFVLNDQTYNIRYLYIYCDHIDQINIPKSITNIDSSASINTIYYEGTLTEWFKVSQYDPVLLNTFEFYVMQEDNTYIDILLEDIIIPSDVTTLNAYAFTGNMKTARIPSTVKYVHAKAFYKYQYNKNTTLIIETGVYRMYMDAFSICTPSLVLLCEDLPTPSAWNSFWSGDATVIWNYKNYIEHENLAYYINDENTVDIAGFPIGQSSQELIIPEDITYEGKTYNVTGIASYAFDHNSTLTNVVIPEHITSIGSCAFEGASIVSLQMSSAFTSIGGYVFSECTNLSNVSIESMQYNTLPSNMFYNCNNITSISLPPTITSIGNYALYIGSAEAPATITLNTPATGNVPLIETYSIPPLDSGRISNIKVHSDLVEELKVSPKWSAYASIIIQK